VGDVPCHETAADGAAHAGAARPAPTRAQTRDDSTTGAAAVATAPEQKGPTR
jgi:hypothetical protein